jgi:hypothetical protein
VLSYPPASEETGAMGRDGSWDRIPLEFRVHTY